MQAPMSYTLPSDLIEQFERHAQAERADGGSIDINPVLPTVFVCTSDGSEYFFQEHEACELLDSVPDNISPEDYILHLAGGW